MNCTRLHFSIFRSKVNFVCSDCKLTDLKITNPQNVLEKANANIFKLEMFATGSNLIISLIN